MSHPTDRAALDGIYLPLRICYGLVPIVAGADKFTNLLTTWDKYLPRAFVRAIPMSPDAFMTIVGVIEIVAGLVVLLGLARLGGLVVAAWLVMIACVVTVAGYYDVAVRDLVMALGAYTLSSVAAVRGEAWLPGRDRAPHAPAAIA